MKQRNEINLIGVISDTHNLLRAEAVEAIKDADLIIHAGDVCNLQILEELNSIAPVVAVRGNNDKGEWAKKLPVYDIIKAQKIYIYVIHDIKEMDVKPTASEFKVVISGHSHKPSIEDKNGVIYLNPGSAGPRRFRLPVSVARLKIDGENVEAEIVELSV